MNVLHSVAFAVVLSVTAYVIIDLEYPRLGFIQISDSDQVLVDLRKSMNYYGTFVSSLHSHVAFRTFVGI